MFFYTKKHAPHGACVVSKQTLPLINLVSRSSEILFGISYLVLLTFDSFELFQFLCYELPLEYKIVKDFLTSKHCIVKRKIISLNPDCVCSYSRSRILPRSILFENVNFSVQHVIHDSNVSVWSLWSDDNISLHQVFHSFYLFPVCKEGRFWHILCIPEGSNLSKF